MPINTTPYDSNTLQSDNEEIRVLQLQPGNWADPITCCLRVVSLNDPSQKYEALSYVWGTKTNETEIIIDDHRTLITNNLFKALRRLRRAKDIRQLWIDTICINQSDNNEKSTQVKLMAKIYERSVKI